MQSVEDILKRNSRVELDKAWETSKTRKAIIIVITYATASVFLVIIENESPFINAFIPTGGYFLSTLSMSIVKNWWVSNFSEKL